MNKLLLNNNLSIHIGMTQLMKYFTSTNNNSTKIRIFRKQNFIYKKIEQFFGIYFI